MGNREHILDFIQAYPGRDDDQISQLLNIRPRQTVNQICRKLESKRLIQRRPNPQGKIGNYPVAGTAHTAAPPLPTTQLAKPVVEVTTIRPARAESVTPTDWFWEGNVVDTLAAYLATEGWAITAQADTASRERGPDLVVSRNAETLYIEAKGYPSVSYRDPARAGERKPTNPTLQAQHWFSHALLKAMRLQGEHPAAQVALAFPDFPRYRALLSEVESGLGKLGLAVFLVSWDGQVEERCFPASPRT